MSKIRDKEKKRKEIEKFQYKNRKDF